MSKGKKPSATSSATAQRPGAQPVGKPKAAKEAAEGKEKSIKVKTRGPFVVVAREEEMEMVQRETHSCGGGFEIEMEEVRPPTDTAGPLDVIKTLCTECGAHVDFHFDISSFYDDEDSGLKSAPSGGGDGPPEGDEDEGGWLS